MGTWGLGAFENDSAGDWVCDLIEEDDGFELVISTLTEAVDNVGGYLEEPVGSEALAAAEVVAAMFRKPGKGLPEEVIEWIEENEQCYDELKEIARKAVEVVKTKSELRELWEESREYDTWVSSLDELNQRLK